MKKMDFALLLTVVSRTTHAQEVYHAYESGIATFSEELAVGIRSTHTSKPDVYT